MWPLKNNPSYSKNIDILVAIVTHLGYTDWNMRSTKNLAKAVGRSEDEVSKVLDEFKALFRKSSFKSSKNLTYYQLHVRYALRWRDDNNTENVEQNLPLEPTTVNALLDFIIKCADQERRHSLGYLSSWIALTIAIASGIFTALATK